jgi:hypothetical protein
VFVRAGRRSVLGRVTGISTKQSAAATSQTIASSVGLAPYSGLAFGNGIVETFARDTDDRMTGVVAKTFTCTPPHSLASAIGSYSACAWAYEADGNRTSEPLDTASTPLAPSRQPRPAFDLEPSRLDHARRQNGADFRL